MNILDDIIRGITNLVEGPLTPSEVNAALTKRAAGNAEHLDWQNSIVDLMKLVGQDSSLQNRERLAAELGYQGAFNGSAEMNTWLHAQVMERLRTS